MKPIDIILITCNRLQFLKQCILAMEERLSTLYRLIIINNNSMDGTTEYLEELKKNAKYEIVLVHNKKPPLLSGCYTQGLEYVDSKYFICTQDDIVIPLLNPDVLFTLIRLIDENPRFGAISLRKPDMRADEWKGEVSRVKTAGAGFRIHRTEEWKKIGGFGNRRWETLEVRDRCINKLNKVVGVATNMWLKDLGYCYNRGYSQKYIDSVKDKDGWSWIKKQPKGLDVKILPEIDKWTHVPYYLGANVLGVKESNKSCGSIFRIQRKKDVEKIGFGKNQFERIYWAKQMNEVLNKKVGIIPRESKVVASEWKNVDKTKGYKNGENIYTLNHR